MAAKSLGVAPIVHATADVRDCELGRYTEVGARTQMAETELGDYSYVVQDCEIIYSRIGKFTSVASHVRINPGNHPMERVSQSHFTYRASVYFEGEADEAAFFERRRSKQVLIGHDVWIGHGATILPGRTVSNGAVVGAGSIVTKSVEPYTIVAGNPARLVRPRFVDHVVERLERLAWWDWDHERLRLSLGAFRTLSVAEFLDRFEGASGSGTGSRT